MWEDKRDFHLEEELLCIMDLYFGRSHVLKLKLLNDTFVYDKHEAFHFTRR